VLAFGYYQAAKFYGQTSRDLRRLGKVVHLNIWRA
jgi:hypothetical protein